MADEITVIGIGVDTSGVEKANAELDRFAAAGARTEAAVTGVASSLSKVGGAAASAGSGIASIGGAAATAAGGLERTQSAASALVGSMGAAGATAGTAAANLEKAGGAAAEMARGFGAVGSAATAVVAGNERAANSLAAFEAASVKAQTAQAALARASLAAAQAQAQVNALLDVGPQRQETIAAATVKAQTAQAALAAATLSSSRAQSEAAKASSAYQESLSKTAAATKLTANESTQLGFQLQDFFVQVQAGQSPLTALLQQGSQLAGTFGGVGGVFRALGTVFTPLRIAIGGAVGAIAGLALAYKAGADESIALERSLILTGNAAGITEGKFNSLAQSVAESTKTGIGSARDTLQSLVSSGQLSGDTLTKVFTAVQAGSKATGQSTEELAKQFVGALDDVGGFAAKLNRTYNVLSADQLKLIQDTAANGDAQKALGLVMDALNPKFAESANKAGFLERAYSAAANAASGFADALKSIGRAQTPDAQLAKLESQIAAATSAGADFGGLGEAGVQALREQADALRAVVSGQQAAAEASAKSAAQEQAKSKFLELQNQNLSKQERFAKEIANANAIADKAGIQGKDREALLKSIADKYRDIGSAAKTAQSAFADLNREFDGQLEVMKARIANGSDLSKSQELELRLNQRLADSVGKVSKSELERLKVKAQEIVAAQKTIENQQTELKAAEQIAQARADFRRSEEKAIADAIAAQEKERESALKSVTDKLQAAKDEEAALVQSRALNISLAEALELVAIARLQEQQARLIEGSDAFNALQKEIDARRELADLIGTKAAREGNEKAAKEAADAWQKSVDQIGQSLTDALMQGGKSALEYIKGLFRSTVLRPIIQGVVNPIAGAVTGALGIGGPAQASSALSAINGGSSLVNAISGSLTSTIGSLVSSAGSLLGSTALTTFATGIKGGTLAAGLAGPTTAGAGGLLGAGASFASAVPYIAGALALFSAKDALFGRKLKDTSITGTLGGDAGFTGATEQFFKGGLFRSNKTETTALGADVASPIAASVQAIKAAVGDYAGALGLPVDQIAGFTQAIKFSTKDLSPEQVQAKLQEAIAGFGDALAETFAGQLGPFQATGEKAGQTLARLASAISGVNPLLDQLGLKVLDVGLAGADAASQIADKFGGLDGLTQASSAYFEAYFSEAERAAKATEGISNVLGQFGLSLPATREEFRALVEAQDLTTESGRESFAALLKVSGAFAELTPVVEETAKAIDEAAAALREQLAAAIDTNIGKFLTPEQQTQRQYGQIAGDLQAAGVDIGLDQLLGATKAQIFDFASAFVAAGENSDAAKLAVVNAAGSLADLKDAAESAAQAVKESLNAAIDANVDKFLSPEKQTERKAAIISDNLAAVGVNFDVDTLLGATKAQIFDFARSFVLAGENSDQAKLAVVEAAGALAEIADAATIAARDLQAAELQKQIDDIAKTFGDLSVIDEPIKTLSDRFVEARDKANGLEDGLAELIGNSAKTIQQTLADLLNSQKALQSYRAGLAATIEETRLRTLSPEARVASLRSTESALFSQLQTAEDPVAVAQKLTAVTLQRIKEEAGIQAKANDANISALEQQIALEEQIRDSQMDALRDQISGFEALRDLAKDMAQFTGTLKFGDLSPLSADRQLAEARSLFESTVQQAAAGDPNAVGNVQGNAQAFLEEARTFFGGSTSEFSAIFADVIGQLDALGVAGQNVDPQIAALEAQLTKLESLNTTTQAVVDTSQQELAALTAIDAALAQRENANAEKIDKQTALAEQQIAEAKAQTEVLRAQVTQQAAIVERLESKLQEVIDIAEAQLNNTTLEAARP